MSASYNPGRVAGCLYLLLGFSVVRPIWVTGALVVRDNPAATVHNIAAHELLFRFGTVADLLAGLSCLVVALALYRVLKGVDQSLAALMIILGGLMPCALDFLNSLNDIAVLQLAGGADSLSAFEPAQRAALAMLFLRLHDYGFLVNEIFAGVWLLPFGILVYRSTFIPRFIGVWLIINGFGYLAISFTGLLAPNYADRVSKFAMPALAGEGAVLLWLLIKGARPPSDVAVLPPIQPASSVG